MRQIQNKNHYKKIAMEYDTSKRSTMNDDIIRDKEIEQILNALRLIKRRCILEVGCGNGYLAEKILDELDVLYTGVDSCKEFISIANSRELKCDFRIDDVTKLSFKDESFGVVISERCLINLSDWKSQKKALDEIHRVLWNKGYCIFIEAFTDGLNNINKARNDIGLSDISVPEFNVFMDKEKFFKYIKNKFAVVDFFDSVSLVESNFLSSYYFFSRVLYPAISKKKISYNTKFVNFFKDFPVFGDDNYCHIQFYVLMKK